MKKLGRPATGRNPVIYLTIDANVMRRLDRWRAYQFDADMNRQRAINVLLDRALPKSKRKHQP